jgi:UDP-2,3-diacylglucosamine pyrophosphatase LpxH
MKPAFRFDEVHVISDLHLGGRAGFQIFDTTAELVLLIDHLRRQPEARNLALVVNGDMVDFLAESPAAYFDPEGAAGKLDRIAGDPSFAPVWTALQRFVATENRTLAVNLGNHDLELALPWVREHLLDLLAGADPIARSRIVPVFDGTGFRCEVGGAQILCVHGNEVDPWNVADYEAIRRIGRDLSFGRKVEPWIPNAGTRLVIEVMNGLKKRYPFVDLLKPEIAAVVPTVLALDSSQAQKVGEISGTVGRLAWDRFRMATGFLGDEARPGGETAGPPPVPSDWAVEVPADSAHALLDRAEERLGKVDPIELVAREEHEEYLGLWGAARRLVRGEPDSEVLRDALSKLKKDTSFALGDEDSTFTRLDGRVGEEIDFLLAGHTHLERSISRKHGPGHYFNTGTWVRLIQLDQPALQDAAQFGSLFQAFKAGTMAALDGEQGLVLRYPAVASIWSEGPLVQSELRRVNAAGPLLTPVSERITRS